MDPVDTHRFGFVALAGPPNSGKSTLLNRLVGQKVSITSRRPQTTRHRITGIKTAEHYQIAFVDTPGLHSARGKALNKVIVRTALSSLDDVDLVLLLIDHKGWTNELKTVLKQVSESSSPIVLLINKIDRLKDKSQLLPLIDESRSLHAFREIIPISALRDSNSELDTLLEMIAAILPVGPPGFPEDQLSDRSDRFLAGELIREQTFATLGQELPYSTAVEIENYEINDKKILCIDATIWVEKDSQKSIVIGKNGQMLKMLGINARKQLELNIYGRVYLNLWVRVKKGWADNLRHLNSLGYDDS